MSGSDGKIELTGMIDVRNTSVTVCGMDVLNRACPFDGFSPFQRCTDGLVGLFESTSSPTEILAYLSMFLIKEEDSKRYLALHLLPTMAKSLDEWLPEPPRQYTAPAKATSSAVYRLGGIGQIYGTDVEQVRDEVVDFREKVQAAKEAQAWEVAKQLTARYVVP